MRRGKTKDFWTFVNKTDTCWLWTGPTSQGYGNFCQYSVSILAHRYSFMCLGGVIPKGKILHHKCKNRLCVNPEHLEVTTRALHSDGAITMHRSITHCPRGHEYTIENTALNNNHKNRSCRECNKLRCKKRRVRKALGSTTKASST